MVRIRRFGVVRTSNVAAVVYFLVTLVFIIPFIILIAAGTTVGQQTTGFSGGAGIVFFLLVPFLYAGLGWVFTAIFCLFYNLAAGFTGGIEVEVMRDTPPAAPMAWQPPGAAPPAPPQAPPPGTWNPPPANPPPG